MVVEVAWDTETYLTQRGNIVPPLVCLTYYDGHENSILGGTESAKKEAADLLRALLSEDDVILIGHNVAYDFAVMARYDPSLIPLIFNAYEEGRIRDTLIREKLINLAFGQLDFKPRPNGKGMMRCSYSLDALVKDYCQVDISSFKQGDHVWRKRYKELDGIPTDRWPTLARTYALDDAKWTLKVYESQKVERYTDVGPVVVDGLVVNELAQVMSDFALHLSAAWGLRTCPTRVAAYRKELEDKIEEQQQRFIDAGIVREGGSKNMKALRSYVKKAYDGHPPKTSKGNIQTSADVLRKSNSQLLKDFGDYNSLLHHLNSFVSTLEEGATRPLTPWINVIRKTGRISYRNPNLQQMPKKGGVRPCFKARDGYVFVSCDYDQFELRVLAQVCLDRFGYSDLAEAFWAGLDPHTAFAAWLLDWSYERTNEAVKDHRHPDHSKADRARDYAKVADFGIPGGLVETTLPNYAANFGLQVTDQESKDLFKAFFKKWREIKPFLDYHKGLTGWGQNYTHVAPFSGRLRGDTRYTAACNSDFQGGASDAMKSAVWLVTRGMYVERGGPLYGSRMNANVHDEILAEVPISKCHVGAMELSKRMNEGAEIVIRDVPIESSPVAMYYWNSEAHQAFDEDGRLIPWENVA